MLLKKFCWFGWHKICLINVKSWKKTDVNFKRIMLLCNHARAEKGI